MDITNSKINLKIFCIDKNHFELRGKGSDELIETIIDNHKKKLYKENPTYKYENFLNKLVDDEFTVWSYCFNRPKENIYWKNFLPKEIGEKQNFKIVEFSYVLFLKYNSEFYAVIGGSGMTVIKKFLDNNFGIDVYQYFAKPKEDILIDLAMRSISGSVSQTKFTFNQNQTVFDSISYSEIPSKIKIIIRHELILKIFKKYSLTPNRPLLEVGNYFYIKKKISYDLLKVLISDINEIRSDDSNYQELTLFKKVKDIKVLEELDNELIRLIVDDVLSLNSPMGKLASSDIIEIVHPSKLEKFYECNRFSIKISKQREDKAKSVFNRGDIYMEAVEYLFSQCDNTYDINEIRSKLFRTDIKGFYNEENLTIGKFLYHVTAELYLNKKKYFRIDANWYYLADEYLLKLKKDAVECYKDNLLSEHILNKWIDGDDEDIYNKSHIGIDGCYILDKSFKENIELCDILKITDKKIYFIHVKNGFDTSMRDLYVQVVLSAKRLWNDLNNNKEISFLKNTFEYYNSKKISRGNKIKTKKVIDQIVTKELEIVYVMAYNNQRYKTKNGWEKINSSKSNIAQYSIVQTSREMTRFLNFKFKVIDISQI